MQQSDPLYGRIADTPGRVIDDPLEGLVVAGVDNQPDIGQQILDLLVVVERIALVNTIRYSFAAQRVFERRQIQYPHCEHLRRVLVAQGHDRELNSGAGGECGLG